MARIETWYNQDLQEAVKVRYIDGNVFSQDNNGNVVGVNVFDNGEPATLGGTVSASVIRADGVTVAVVGTLSGNKASVVLPQSAYDVPGAISVVIKLTSDSDITTLCAVVGNVYISSTDSIVDPGTIIPSIETLIAEIEAAVASIPADYSSLWSTLAPAFSSSVSYKAWQYVTYDGKLYRFAMDHSAGSMSSADVIAVNVGSELSEIRSDCNIYRGMAQYFNQNQWDEIWTKGGYSFTTGVPIDGNYVRCVNPISVVPGHSYYLVSSQAVVMFKYDASDAYLGQETVTANSIITIPDGVYYIRFRTAAAYGIVYNYDISINYDADDHNYHPASFDFRHVNLKSVNGVRYVSPYGNDNTGDGSVSNAFRTVNRALEDGGDTILCAAGYYYETIDLSNAKHGNISICAMDKDRRTVFTDPNRVVITSETKTDGYTKVYQAASDSPGNNCLWIYQDAANEISTLITDNERHPLQRGLQYRCEDTRIIKCTATTLSDALSEIDASSDYKWFYDNGTLYFSRRLDVDSSHPIIWGVGGTMFINATRANTINLGGLFIKYYRLNFNDTSNSVASDCSVYNCYSMGGCTWDGAINATFIKCEVCHTQSGQVGDGFNAHSVTTGIYTAHQTSGRLIDCWSHDNNDDGYSDHERCECIVRGGLYEYNGKGGVVPSYGSHCICYNVLSRHNMNGFYCTGAATEAEGGKYTQMMCFGCVAESNTKAGTYNYNSGFIVDGSGNKMELVDCVSIGNAIGYNARVSTVSARLIDCKTSGDTTAKGGNGTFFVINANAVT